MHHTTLGEMKKKHRRLTLSQTTRIINIIRVDWNRIQAFKTLFPQVDTSEIKADPQAMTLAIPIRIAREIVKHHCL